MGQQVALPEEQLARRAGVLKVLSMGLLCVAGVGAIILTITWLFDPTFSIISILILDAVVILTSSITYSYALKQQRLSLENKGLVESLQHSNKLLSEANQELREATQAKSEFMAHMSHELRTPLNVIIGFSELMVDGVPGKVNREQKQSLNDILSSGQHLLSLINDILDLSRVEAGKMELRLSTFAIRELIESIRSVMLTKIAQENQGLDVEIEEGLPPVFADTDRITQVLTNLLSNGTKFTPDGGKLKIEVVREDNWCQVSVIDDGIGIKKADQERIFEPFCQLENPLTTEKGGTGLGLTIARQIIERHGGRLWVESEYGKGSRFTFTVPLAADNEGNPR